MNMFCYQCQETAKNSGCTVKGVCGKTARVSNLQDLLIYNLKGIADLMIQAKKYSISFDENNKGMENFIIESLFSTITNVNFDENYFVSKIGESLKIKNHYRELLEKKADEKSVVINDELSEATVWQTDDVNEYHKKAVLVGVLSIENEDVRSLKELLMYGLKGLAAYYHHANVLGYYEKDIFDFVIEALDAVLNETLGADELTGLVLKCGEFGVKTMALLDKANTESYGNPEPTEVNIGAGKNPGILISGHDLKDMEELLKQTEGTGVDIYTHGEMLPAHYYPNFKKYAHFLGNYGGSWWKQAEEFEKFNGPILMTTNCIVPPRNTYKDRLYTTGTAGYDGIKHIEDRTEGGMKNFAIIIEQAKKCASPEEIESGKIVGGFAHNYVLSIADKILDAVKSGAIKNFIVLAGCDGRHSNREYYTDFAEGLPKDAVILTAGCAKYRYNKLLLGDIGGIPRVLDAGQCNDSYSLAIIALKLAEVLGVGINDLPIIYNIAWYEQKAVIVLLALIYLGVKKIHLGPTLPAFISPNIAKVLIEKFEIGGVTNANDDLDNMLSSAKA